MAHQTVNNGMTQKIAETVTLSVSSAHISAVFFLLNLKISWFIQYTYHFADNN